MGNQRFELRAYEESDSCRLASMILELWPGVGSTVSRNDLAARWAKRYPRHAQQTGKKAIRNRISSALTLLKVAGMVRAQQGSDVIAVADAARLRMAANNLAILEDGSGMSIRPALWTRRPNVPTHLLAAQAPLEARRLEDAKRLREES